jgi:hypothetical protein
MGEDMAALYLGVSMTKFRERVGARVYPQPAREGGRLFWSRRQLDLYVDRQFGIASNDQGDNSWDDFK